MRLRRQPRPELRPFVRELWFADDPSSRTTALVDREHTLPSGDMHIVFRLSGRPVRLFRDHLDRDGNTLGFAVVGGARARFYVKEVCAPVCTAGAVLMPGASLPLFDAPASEFGGPPHQTGRPLGQRGGFCPS